MSQVGCLTGRATQAPPGLQNDLGKWEIRVLFRVSCFVNASTYSKAVFERSEHPVKCCCVLIACPGAAGPLGHGLVTPDSPPGLQTPVFDLHCLGQESTRGKGLNKEWSLLLCCSDGAMAASALLGFFHCPLPPHLPAPTSLLPLPSFPVPGVDMGQWRSG